MSATTLAALYWSVAIYTFVWQALNWRADVPSGAVPYPGGDVRRWCGFAVMSMLWFVFWPRRDYLALTRRE